MNEIPFHNVFLQVKQSSVSGFSGRISLFILAILVNSVLMAIIPAFFQRDDIEKIETKETIPVHFIRINRKDPSPPPEKAVEKKPEKVEMTPREIPTVHLQHKVQNRVRMDMKLPEFTFEINPKLTGGIAVTAPPPMSVSKKLPVSHDGPAKVLKDFYEEGEVDQVPVATARVNPVYPFRARRLGITGDVKVRFLVDKEGMVSNIKVLKASPPEVFNKSVERAIASWRFKPGKVKGEPVRIWVVTSVKFEIE